LVTQVVLDQSFLAEVERRRVIRAGNHVPGSPAAAEVINRCERAGDMERLAESGGYGRAQPYVTRHCAECRDQGRRLETGDERGMISGSFGREPVGDKKKVELSAFGDARNGLQHRPAAVARACTLIAPSGGMIASPQHEYSEMHLTFRIRHADCL